MRTVSVFGIEMPVIAVLSDEYVLAEHPNGPVVVAEAVGFISILRFDVDDPDGVPVEVMNKAVLAYIEQQREKDAGVAA